MIEVKNISKIYKEKKGKETVALRDVSLKLPNVGLIFINGKSGSGKSTLLNILGLLEDATNGEVIINGKNINKFREIDKTTYRSKEIGFVFQEFDLIDELNVYENVELALDLIRDKTANIDELLTSLGINDLKARKISELSGGEKQRVAIARAIVKKPSIILADEPTGNLDSENSEAIFKILKNLSYNHLVIVVSHDTEASVKYGDGIIKLVDGSITENTVKTSIFDDNKSVSINPRHISIAKSLKLAFGFIKRKKFRLVLTSLITSVAFALLAFSFNLVDIDMNRVHVEAMEHDNNYNMEINKYSYPTSNMFHSIYPSEVLEITNKYPNSEAIGNIYLANMPLNLYSSFDILLPDEDNAYYFTIVRAMGNDINVTTMDEEELSELDLIGNIPTEANEIIISELLAKYYLEYGYVTPEYNEEYKIYEGKTVEINSIDELIDKTIYINFYTHFKIKGILKDDNITKYDSLKTEDYNKMQKESSELYKEYSNYVNDNLSKMIVNDNFFEVTTFIDNNRLDYDFFDFKVNYNGKDYYNIYNIEIVDEVNSVNVYENDSFAKNGIYDGNSFVENMTLNSGEVIIEKEVIDRIYPEINDELMRLYAESDNPEMLTQEYIDNYYLDFINKNNIIGSTIEVSLTNPYKDNETKTYNLTIKGIRLFNPALYLNSVDFAEYMIDHYVVWRVLLNEDNPDKVKEILDDFSNNDYSYRLITDYTDKINDITGVLNSINKIIWYIVAFFLAFAVILLLLFISSSTKQNKKKIGILRAIGAKTSDVVRVFFLESLLIGIITLVLATILSIAGIIFMNAFLSNEMGIFVHLMLFNSSTVIYLIGIIIIVIFVSLIVPTISLSRKKPIVLIK